MACKKVLHGEPFVKRQSASVLDTLNKVPADCLYPVLSRTVKSDRFRLKRQARVDSEGDESVASSSGSGHDEKYKPRPSSTHLLYRRDSRTI